jgi:hypothetical protein
MGGFSLSTQETEYSVSCVEETSPLSIPNPFRNTLSILHYTKFLTVPCQCIKLLHKEKRKLVL